MNSTIAVIDGDIIAYRAAAACETRSILATHRETGVEISCPHRTALKAQIQGSYDLEEFTIKDVQEPSDVSYAFHSVNTTIDKIKDACKTKTVEIYLGGENNFRDYLPLPTKYKSGRQNNIRPILLEDVRNFLVNKKGAVVVNSFESDDMLAMRCNQGLKNKQKIIAATIDGDQNGVEGWMYNWTKMNEPKLIRGLGEIYLTKEKKDFDGYGRKFFYAQWVYGDWGTDTFKPSELSKKKFGIVSMFNLLENCDTDKDCLAAVYEQYLKWYPNPVTYTAWNGQEHTKDVFEIMDMYAACAHMMRWEGDILNSKQILSKAGIISLTN